MIDLRIYLLALHKPHVGSYPAIDGCCRWRSEYTYSSAQWYVIDITGQSVACIHDMLRLRWLFGPMDVGCHLETLNV